MLRGNKLCPQYHLMDGCLICEKVMLKLIANHSLLTKVDYKYKGQKNQLQKVITKLIAKIDYKNRLQKAAKTDCKNVIANDCKK